MAVPNVNVQPQTNDFNESELIDFICPICKSHKTLNFPESVINETRQLTTISIPTGLVCDHHFQAFIDKNFKVRGYQKVDYEFHPVKNYPNFKKIVPNECDQQFFNSLILEGNYLEYHPKNNIPVLNSNKPDPHQSKDENSRRNKTKTLKEIYDEFWEFIDENNETFKRFIEGDKRRKSSY